MSLKLGEKAPRFKAMTTHGELDFYDWAGDSWVLLFSHPADFTPVCTTEMGTVARYKDEWEKRGVKAIGISVDPVDDHHEWIKDIEETQKTDVYYPIVADEDRKVAELYGMIHPEALATATVRSVFIIDPNKKIRMTLTYPASTGRNFPELLRVIDSLQLTDSNSVATPADWKMGDRVIISPSITDKAELDEKFPQGYEVVKPYLRYTQLPEKS
ncbi:peroxiredoxin [Bradymonas sediminis]|uniref:Peroxiredoxin n=1 Tax=Bradymonas sediminis TaxID=1548548 RepID=A0A2Z4FPM8_9DELT|nr:peroxiredoxin [Bradymonas sediminis]AWV90686.1 peroxiredoxin [Bradymonas sediminis]TDP62674.1 1-Cys peroxiredoxin [Bradymonas sediminis]